MRSERILGVLGMSFSEWRAVKLEEIIEIEMGQSPKSEFYNQTGEGLPFLQGNRTFGDKYPYFDTYCTENKKIANTNDVIMSVRAPVGDLNIAQTKISLGRGVCAMRLKGEQNSNYLFYLMKHNIKEMINRESGTVFGSVNKKDILGLEVKITNNKFEQKAIAHILSTLDDKIEVNNQMNKTLENMAQAIFKQWFVDFEFPNEDGESYKSSGGEMVESELGLIPKGWEVASLYDIADYINGTSFKKNEVNEFEGIPIIKIVEIKNGYSKSTSFYNGTTNKAKKYYLRKRDILFSWSGNPETSIDIFIWSKEQGILNQHIFKVEPYDYSKSYIYFLLKNFKSVFMDIASNKQTTGLGHVTVADLKRLKTPIPNEEILSEFIKISDVIIEKIFNNMQEIETLQSLRDSLLPKLLSGEIRVPLDEEGVVS